jgi:hypothetical protein
MPAQLDHHGSVIPLARADEELHGLALQACLQSDRFARLAFQPAEQAADDQGRVVTLLAAREVRQITLQERRQPLGTAPHRLGPQHRVGQKGLRHRMIQERHEEASLPWMSPPCITIPQTSERS